MPTKPFTRSAYAGYLEQALGAGYVFESFAVVQDPEGLPPHRFILLRHDIDYDPAAVPPIRRLESERGVRATYFFQRRCPFYSLDDPTARQVVSSEPYQEQWQKSSEAAAPSLTPDVKDLVVLPLPYRHRAPACGQAKTTRHFVRPA